MDKRVVEWIDTHGRRLIELQIKGGEEFFVRKSNRSLTRLDDLSGDEWIEFFSLLGQLDGILYSLEPSDPLKASSFHRSIKRRMKKMEKHCRHIYEITGMISIPKTSA